MSTTPLTRDGLRQMIIEACGDAAALGDFKDLKRTNISPDEAFSAGEVHGVEETCPTCGAASSADTARASVKRDDPGRVMGHGGRSRMAREQLYKIAEYADDLWNLLGDDDELPEWVQSKIAVMADNVGEVKHHVEYKTVKGESHG